MSNRKKLLRSGPYSRAPKMSPFAFAPPRPVAESAVAVEERPASRVSVVEADAGGTTVAGSGRLFARLIRAGWSLNRNHYGASVLRAAAGAFKRGTLCYADHASDAEEDAHPAGSIKNLAGVLHTDAYWDEAEQALMAEIRLFSPWRAAIEDMKDAIGLSIRAWVVGEEGEADGQSGFVVSEIVEGRSVDFVTVPAAGGAILSVLEAVGNKVPTAEARNVAHWMESRIHADFTARADDMFGDGRLTREERIVLSGAVGDALAAFSARIEQDAPQLLNRDIWTEPDPPVVAAASEVAERAAEPVSSEQDESPAADAAEVREDVTDGAPPTAPPTQEEEPAMSGTTAGAPPVEAGTATVADTAVSTVEAVTTPPAQPVPDVAAIVAEAITRANAPLLEQIQAMQARESQREAADRAERNRQRAREAVDAALRSSDFDDVRAQIAPRVTSTVLANVPTTAEGVVDEARLAEAITGAATSEATFVRQTRAEALEAAGVGNVLGLGGTSVDEAEKDTSGLTDALTSLYNNLGLSAEQSKIAVAGRGF